MGFAQSGLPQQPRIQKCFERLTEVFNQKHGPEADNMLTHLSKRGMVLSEALGVERAEPLICAQFLSFLDRDTYEYDNIPHEYGDEVFRTLKNIASFRPLFSAPEYLAEVLKDPDVKKEARIHYMATAIAEMRQITEAVETGNHNPSDPELRDRAACAKLIATGCLGAEPFLDLVMQEDLARMTNALNRQPNPPRFSAQGPRYTLQ